MNEDMACAQFADFRFADICSNWKSCQVPISEADKDSFGLDGSSIPGFQPIENSDLLILPDRDTVFRDCFNDFPVDVYICNVADTDGYPYDCDPRGMANRTEALLAANGYEAAIGPELEYFVFDDLTLEPNNKLKMNYKAVSPVDKYTSMRFQMVSALQGMGVEVSGLHAEVASNQSEISLKHGGIVRTADALMKAKYAVANVAARCGKISNFDPRFWKNPVKPNPDDNASGCHCNISLKRGDESVFAGDKYAGLSQECLWFIGGLLKHGPALAAFTNPTVDSYQRIKPGFEAPTILCYGAKNRSCAIRIPHFSDPECVRIELRVPDPIMNPYLGFSAIVLAGLDGMKNKIDSGSPMEANAFESSKRNLKNLPASLEESLDALDDDHSFLDGVFTESFVQSYIEVKRKELKESENEET